MAGALETILPLSGTPSCSAWITNPIVILYYSAASADATWMATLSGSDLQIGGAALAHLGEGDFLQAIGHGPLTPPIGLKTFRRVALASFYFKPRSSVITGNENTSAATAS